MSDFRNAINRQFDVFDRGQDVLEKMVKDYPASAVARLALLRKYKESGSSEYQKLREESALYMGNVPWYLFVLSHAGGSETADAGQKESSDNEVGNNLPEEPVVADEVIDISDAGKSVTMVDNPSDDGVMELKDDAHPQVDSDENVAPVEIEEESSENPASAPEEVKDEFPETLPDSIESPPDDSLEVSSEEQPDISREEGSEGDNKPELIGMIDEVPEGQVEIRPAQDTPLPPADTLSTPVSGELPATDTHPEKATYTEESEEIGENTDTPPGDLEFEPLYTVDYFASQGIKLSENELKDDKLSQQVRSFTGWLKSMKKLHPGRLPEQNEVIERIIQTASEKSNVGSDVLTEAMAEVLVKQNKKEKAIEMYEKLSLMNPSKSAYFAAKIESLKTA